VAQQCEHNLASSSWTENSGIILVVQQLDQYLTEVQHTSADMAPTNAISFWKQKSTIYSLLAPVAEDFVCAPASQAYVERIFLCADSV